MKLPSQVNKKREFQLNSITTTSACVAQFIPINPDNTKLSTNTSSYIEDDTIIGCTIAMDKNTPTGSFDLHLKAGVKNLKQILHPGDWVLIYLDTIDKINLKTLSGLRVIGSITRIAENKITMGDGSIVTTYTISGGNWGKILEKTDIYYDPYLPKDLQSQALKAAVFDIYGGPVDFINAYLNVFLGNAKEQDFKNIIFQLLIPPKLYDILPKINGDIVRSKGSDVCFNDVMVRDFYDNANEGFAINRPLTKVINGSVWSVIGQAHNRELNELYLNVKNGQPTMTIRKQPLTKELRLERINQTINNESHSLGLKYIVNSNLGSSDHALFNYVVLIPADEMNADYIFASKGEYQDAIPQINRDSISKFGIRRVELSTEFGYSTNITLDTKLLLKWIKELGEYWLNYYRFENGTIEVIGKNDFYIGDYYHIPETNKSFLVESIQWEWKYRSPITVSLGVTHGIMSDGGFIDEAPKTNNQGISEVNSAQRFY